MTTAATAAPATRPTESEKYELVSIAGTKIAIVKIWTLRRGGGSSRLWAEFVWEAYQDVLASGVF